jgi:cobalt-zinc-cadmium efflux system outer membrane protein
MRAARRIVVISVLVVIFGALSFSQVVAPAPGGAPPAQQHGTSTPLSALLEEAKKNNPAVLAANAAVKTSTFGPAQAGAFPDSEFMVQSFSVGDPRPFAGFRTSDFAYIGVGASQELPFPGKRALRRNAAGKEIDISQAEASTTVADTLVRIKTAYFTLARTQAVVGLLERNGGVIEQIEQATQIRYRTGTGTQQDVLRAQLERSRLSNEIAMQLREGRQAQAQLRALLNRSATSPDIVAEPLQLRTPAIPSIDSLTDNPELQVERKQVEKAAAEVELAQREKRPDFGVQYMWQHTSENFRDYYMGTFSIRLPNRKRVDAAASQAEARKSQIEAMQAAQLRQLQGELEEELAMLQTTENQLLIYRDGLIPQSEAAFNTGMTGYRTGRQEYQALLASYSDTLRLGIDYQQVLAEHEATIARIERLIGGDLK